MNVVQRLDMVISQYCSAASSDSCNSQVRTRLIIDLNVREYELALFTFLSVVTIGLKKKKKSIDVFTWHQIVFIHFGE